MNRVFDNFRKTIEKELSALNSPELEKVLSVFQNEINKLLGKGVISIGPDYNLSGIALEYRVKDIFREIGFDVKFGPPKLYDAIIYPFAKLKIEKPIVLEIKSSKSVSPTRTDLRQLDDWVFELSGEKIARKYGLGGEPDMYSIGTGGWFPKKQTHPTPHKGVMVFNGPLGQPLEQRAEYWLGENENEFAQKRGFCIISLASLISWHDECKKNASIVHDFWNLIHSTAGKLPFYKNI